MKNRFRHCPQCLKIIQFALMTSIISIFMSTTFFGCAQTAPKKNASGKTKSTSVKVNENSELLDLIKVVKTADDAAILELLMGYRMLLLNTPDASSMDKETLKKSRQAYDKLESILRHGGVKAPSKDGGERIFTVTSEDKLSLQEVVQAASVAAEKNAREGEWDKARVRWKEMVQSKAAINIAIDEAQWGITLVDALQSTMADSLKIKLKAVNESYVAEMNQAEISKQVKVLLEQISEVKIQRELKRLANRAWERDKKAGNLITAPESAQALYAKSVSGIPNSMAETDFNLVTKPSGPGGATIADTLMMQGKYVAALKSLDQYSDQVWVKDKKNQIGERFCEEKRRGAANSFKDFKKAASDSLKRIHLKRTTAELDSCLFYFPDLVVAQKVRKNRELVEAELKKLKP